MELWIKFWVLFCSLKFKPLTFVISYCGLPSEYPDKETSVLELENRPSIVFSIKFEDLFSASLDLK